MVNETARSIYTKTAPYQVTIVQAGISSYFVSWYAKSVFSAMDSLFASRIFDPIAATFGATSPIGFCFIALIPFQLYQCGKELVSEKSLPVRVFNVLYRAGQTGSSVGLALQAVSFVWEQVRPHLAWVPLLQVVSAAFASLYAVQAVHELRALKKIEGELVEAKQIPAFTKEFASEFLGVAPTVFDQFKKTLDQLPPKEGMELLRGRVREKITQQKLIAAASIISVIATAIFVAMAFTPLAPGAVTALAIVSFGLNAVSSGLTISALCRRVKYTQIPKLDPVLTSSRFSEKKRKTLEFLGPYLHAAA